MVTQERNVTCRMFYCWLGWRKEDRLLALISDKFLCVQLLPKTFAFSSFNENFRCESTIDKRFRTSNRLLALTAFNQRPGANFYGAFARNNISLNKIDVGSRHFDNSSPPERDNDFKADHIMVIMTVGAIPDMFPVRIFVVWMRGMIHQLDPVT